MQTMNSGDVIHVLRAVGLALTVAGLSPSAVAQPDADPELTDESVTQLGASLRDDSDAGARPVAPVEAPRAYPVRPHAPDIESVFGNDGAGLTLTEGSFLIAQRGLVARTPSGAWVFAPEADPELGRVRPMVILPSMTLSRLGQLAGEADQTSDLALSGRVTLYRGQNYLLLTAITPLNESPAPEAEQEPATESVIPNELDQATRDLIADLEAARTGVRGVIASAGSAEAGTHAAIAEGRVISRRRARLVRLDAGELAVRFDNDLFTDDAAVDVPLVIAPSAALHAIETLIETHGDQAPVIVSGQTLAFGGRNYILPTGLSLDVPTEISSRQ